MEIRANVYSPLQNTAVWLGAWLYDLVPTEDVIDAFVDLGGPHTFHDGGLLDFLRTIKDLSSELIDAPSHGPILNLALSGPGQAPALPAGSEAAREAAVSPEGVFVLGGVDKHEAFALIPDRGPEGTDWEIVEVDGFRPNMTIFSPGEADQLLKEATDTAARIIESSGYASLAPKSLKNPRLTVGMLSDFYDTPGLPFVVPERSAKLFARADRVAAIAETVQSIIGDHSLDPQLISLWSHIRTARMTGVSYALAEFARA